MGTRADFYVGRGKDSEWLGSIAWDGYPDGVPSPLFGLKNERAYRAAVESILANASSATRPADGWPWPWRDSRTTDYAYTWDEGQMWIGGECWRSEADYIAKQARPAEEEDEYFFERGERAEYPDMTDRQNVTFGKRSGVLIVGLK